ncbi:guanylate cyclase domain-containing protein [Haematococcus lacustris]|uniref:Guanylate cyclase domain-containing protein n=1 Tax=Haematococcus lacustris TaxID=44745 RepID=A0A699ZLD7_HAELA|nr:guanylate cyclase domain-containing protein [Haematococcus lacustris]
MGERGAGHCCWKVMVEIGSPGPWGSKSTAPPGRIQVTEATYRLLPHEQWEPTGGVEVKGKVGC